MTTAPVKFCGMTRAADMLAALELGAAAVGLNFYSKSKRSVSVERAVELAGVVAGSPLGVWGVFVDEPMESVVDVAEKVGLSAVQLSGNETPDDLAELHAGLSAGVVVIKTLPVDGRAVFRRAEAFESGADRFLLDAHVGGQYGGTGRVADWDIAAEFCRKYPDTILAGGITPENAGIAYRTVRPAMLDVASGIECAGEPGIKSREKMQAIIDAIATVYGNTQ